MSRRNAVLKRMRSWLGRPFEAAPARFGCTFPNQLDCFRVSTSQGRSRIRKLLRNPESSGITAHIVSCLSAANIGRCAREKLLKGCDHKPPLHLTQFSMLYCAETCCDTLMCPNTRSRQLRAAPACERKLCHTLLGTACAANDTELPYCYPRQSCSAKCSSHLSQSKQLTQSHTETSDACGL